jgi:hypothetical protein
MHCSGGSCVKNTGSSSLGLSTLLNAIRDFFSKVFSSLT